MPRLFTPSPFAFAGAVLLAGAAGAPAAAQTIEIRDFVGVIVWSEGPAFAATFTPGAATLAAPEIEVAADGVTVTGQDLPDMDRLSCRSDHDGEIEIGRWGRFWGRGDGEWTKLTAYGRLDITTPANPDLTLSGGVSTGAFGDLAAAKVTMSHCGDLELGRIAGDAAFSVVGSGDLEAESVGGDAVVSVLGSGDITVGDIGGAAGLDVSGSGDIEVGDVAGALEASVNGSGDLDVGGAAGPAALSIGGSGDLTIARLAGRVTARAAGSSDITIGGGQIAQLTADVSGSGNISVDAEVGELVARASGSGDITVARVTGSVEASESGSGSVNVRSR